MDLSTVSKGLDDICNHNMQLIPTNTGQNLLNIQSSGKPGFHRGETITQTENRLSSPTLNPITQMTKPERGPQRIFNRKNTEGPLT